jgi:hypothetical protein
MGYADLRSFAQGSGIGGGKASGAIVKNLAAFGHHDPDGLDAEETSKYTLGDLIAKSMDQGEGKQMGGNAGLAIKALGGHNQLAGAVGDDYISEGGEGEEGLQGMKIAQPGSLTKDRQYLLTGRKVEDGKDNLKGYSDTPISQTDMSQSPVLQHLYLNSMMSKFSGF